jgi:hypothetical protein
VSSVSSPQKTAPQRSSKASPNRRPASSWSIFAM